MISYPQYLLISMIYDKAKSIQSSTNIIGLLQSEISKLENLSRGTSHTELDEYKLTMEKERSKAEKISEQTNKRKSYKTVEEENFAKSSGLNPSVISMMLDNSDDDTDHKTKKKKKKMKMRTKKRKNKSIIKNQRIKKIRMQINNQIKN